MFRRVSLKRFFCNTNSTPGSSVNLNAGWLLALPPVIGGFAYLSSKSDSKSGSEGIRTVYIIRHGESLGNVSLENYEHFGDHNLPLTEDGKKMAANCGEFLNKYFEIKYGSINKKPPITMFVSPFTRTRQTAQGLLQTPLGNWISNVRENPQLVEQDWGLFEGHKIGVDDLADKFSENYARVQRQKDEGGRFYARFPQGESALDVVMRVDNFVGTISRDDSQDIIVVTHGVTGRALIMRLLQWPPEWFETSTNLPNCSVYMLDMDKSWHGKFIYGGFGQEGISQKVPIKKLNKHKKECEQRAMAKLQEFYGDKSIKVTDP